MSTIAATSNTTTKRRRGRPTKPAHERRVRKSIGFLPADLRAFEALERLDSDWLAKAVRAACLTAGIASTTTNSRRGTAPTTRSKGNEKEAASQNAP